MRLIDADDLIIMEFGGIKFVPKEFIDNAPTIEPERKPGRWIKISPANIYECSECGKNVMTADIDAYDFCHGCGAKMEQPKREIPTHCGPKKVRGGKKNDT